MALTGRVDLFGRAWEITEDNGDGTVDIQLCHDDDNLVTSATLDSVKALGGSEGYRVGTRGLLCIVADGTLRFIAARGNPPMIVAKADMTADDTEYACKYLEADGTEGTSVNCRRPNGVEVDSGDVGFVGRDSSAQNIFVPCHARHNEDLAITMEVRGSDPSSPETGRFWLRT